MLLLLSVSLIVLQSTYSTFKSSWNLPETLHTRQLGSKEGDWNYDSALVWMLLAHVKGQACWCQYQIHLPMVVCSSLQFSCVCFFRDLLNFVTYLMTELLCLPLLLLLLPEKGTLRPWWELMIQKPNLKWVHGDMGAFSTSRKWTSEQNKSRCLGCCL